MAGDRPTDEVTRVGDVSACLITLRYGDRNILIVLLDRAGSINRMGNGTPDPIVDNTLYIGVIDEPLLDRLLEVVPEEMIKYMGKYDEPDPKGVRCTCTVHLQHSDRVSGIDFTWGSESGGLPNELVNVIVRAVELTDPWWKSQPGDPNVHYFGGPEANA